MIWDNDEDSQDKQRFKNLIFLKMPVSNETRDEMLPIIGVATIVVIIGIVIYNLT